MKLLELKGKYFDILRQQEHIESARQQVLHAILKEEQDLQMQKEIENGKGNVVQESTSKN